VIGPNATATVAIAVDPAVLSIEATDPDAAEAGLDPGVFTVRRSGGDLRCWSSPANQSSAIVTVVAILSPRNTVYVIGAPSAATVTIADDD